MEFFVVIAVVGAIWWITKWADSPASPNPPPPTHAPIPAHVEEIELPPIKNSPQETFRKAQALLEAREGRLARAQLLQILDNAHRLGITADERGVFEMALKAKAPIPLAPSDPRTIVISGPKGNWNDDEHEWLNSDEYRRRAQEALDDR